MENTLPNIVVNGRIYTPAISLEETTKFLLENFENEAFPLSELVSDLEGKAIQTVFKFDENEKIYTLSFSGNKDEFSVISGPILTKEMIKAGFIALSANALNERLQNEGVQFWKTGFDWFQGKEPETVYSN